MRASIDHLFLPAIKGVSLGAVLLLSGCGWMGGDDGLIVDRTDDYLKATTREPLRIPPGLSREAIEPLLVVPELSAVVEAEFYPRQAPRPTAMFGPQDAGGVRIQFLGEDHWLVVPQTPAVVWPQVVGYMLTMGVGIAHQAPGEGRLVSDWIDLSDAEGDPLREAILEARAEAGITEGRDRLRVRLEPGLRQRSTEVVVRLENESLNELVPTERSLPERITSGSLERTLLNEMGSYVAANMDEATYSLVAQTIGVQTRSSIERDSDGDPVLRLDLAYDRAWATLRQALEEAEINIQDMDRSEGVFYLALRDSDLTGGDDRWFLRRWLRPEGAREVELRIREAATGYEVYIDKTSGEGIARDTRHNFLTKLREHAT